MDCGEFGVNVADSGFDSCDLAWIVVILVVILIVLVGTVVFWF